MRLVTSLAAIVFLALVVLVGLVLPVLQMLGS
jgi:hypothetical protein